MPTKTIYVPDEALPVFNKAKEIAGESLSAVVIQALNDLILKKELEEKCMEPFERWVGTDNYSLQVANGNKVKFYGKKLSEAQQDIMAPDIIYYYELFYTRKGQFLLYSLKNDRQAENSVSKYTLYPNLKAIMEAFDVPTKLIFDAEKQMPGVACEILDV